MHIQAGVAKIGKYASGESGDTLEMVERPHGGISFILVDGQSSGRAAKLISTMVARKAVSLLAEGVRDGAAARAASDALHAQRGGRVSATLNIVSIDMRSKTLVISRNSHCPVLLQYGRGEQTLLAAPTSAVGLYAMTRPEITEVPLESGVLAVVYTDGVLSAGSRRSEPLDVMALVNRLYAEHFGAPDGARAIADGILAEVLRLDDGRPVDDTSVLVVAVVGDEIPDVRRLQLDIPIPPLLRP